MWCWSYFDPNTVPALTVGLPCAVAGTWNLCYSNEYTGNGVYARVVNGPFNMSSEQLVRAEWCGSQPQCAQWLLNGYGYLCIAARCMAGQYVTVQEDVGILCLYRASFVPDP